MRNFASREMCLEYVRLSWPCYLPNGTDVEVISMVEVQDALTKPASTTANAVVADVAVSTACAPSSPAMRSVEEDKTEGDPVKV